MHLDDYFDFLAPNDIRLKGTRIGIETVLDAYLRLGQTPAAIAARYPSLTPEQVCATLTYYYRHQAVVDAYLTEWRAYCERARHDSEATEPPGLRRLRAMIAHYGRVRLLAELRGKGRDRVLAEFEAAVATDDQVPTR